MLRELADVRANFLFSELSVKASRISWRQRFRSELTVTGIMFAAPLAKFPTRSFSTPL